MRPAGLFGMGAGLVVASRFNDASADHEAFVVERVDAVRLPPHAALCGAQLAAVQLPHLARSNFILHTLDAVEQRLPYIPA